MIPEDRYYTEEHEWVKIEGNRAIVGITDHAQSELGDIVFVELPELDEEYDQGSALATVESVKAVSEVYSPVSGMVIEVNEALEDSPELVNEDPYGDGWIAVFEVADNYSVEGLMTAEKYEEFLAEEED